MPQWWSISIDWLEERLIPCPFKFLTGCDCPACGTQRSFLSLLRGDLIASWNENPIAIGTCVIMVAYLLGRWQVIKQGIEYARWMGWILAAVVMLKWLFKLA